MIEQNLMTQTSFTGAKWRSRQYDNVFRDDIQNSFQTSPILSSILASKGLSYKGITHYLDPTLKNLMPDPNSFKDMDKAISRIIDAITKKETIAVFADYDVDGATSASLLIRFFRHIRHDIISYIPDRMTEGYGPNEIAFDRLKEQGVDLVITVDCGISAFDALAHAKKIGLDVIVLDHHQASAILPEAVSIVNPNRLDETGDFGHLAAVGVVFLTLVALHKSLRDDGYYEEKNITPPDLRLWLDLVALGTICDVVPLKGLNRAFVRQGLKIMAKLNNQGISSLYKCADITPDLAIHHPSAYHCGFVLGPRINAGGRVGKSDLGTVLLSTEDKKQADEIANILDIHNRERKEIEAQCLMEAEALYQQQKLKNPEQRFILVAQKGWHPGVIGIVAGRLKESHHLPTIVIALDDHGVGKGSARSIEGVDMGAIISSLRDQGYLINGGGHAMAAGLTIDEEKLDSFNKMLEDEMQKRVSRDQLVRHISFDAALSLSGANLDLLDELEQLQPFGAGNAEPRFLFTNVAIDFARIVGENHLSLTFGDEMGGRLKAIAFRATENGLADHLLDYKKQKKSCAVIGKLRRDHWQGFQKVQMIVEDAGPAFSL